MENIFFEKDAVLKLAKKAKEFGKVLIITSPSAKQQYFQMLSNFFCENKITFWAYSLKETKCTSDNILKACSFARDARAIVSLGAGTVCDVSKIVGKKLSLPVFVLPTTITHFGIFNNVAILNDGLPQYVETSYPEGVFLDEAIIQKSPERFVKSSLCFALSLLEAQFSFEASSVLTGEKSVNTEELEAKIKKIEELVGWLSLSKGFAILNLMDYIIDIFQILNGNFKVNSILFASKLSSSTLKQNFGEKALICSKILLQSYVTYFNQRIIIPKNIPNFEVISRILSQIPVSGAFFNFENIEEKFNNFIAKTNGLLASNLRLNLQKFRTFLLERSILFCQIISKFNNKLRAIDGQEGRLRMIDEQELFSSLQILPFLGEGFLPNLLLRYGYLNVG